MVSQLPTFRSARVTKERETQDATGDPSTWKWKYNFTNSKSETLFGPRSKVNTKLKMIYTTEMTEIHEDGPLKVKIEIKNDMAYVDSTGTILELRADCNAQVIYLSNFTT